MVPIIAFEQRSDATLTSRSKTASVEQTIVFMQQKRDACLKKARKLQEAVDILRGETTSGDDPILAVIERHITALDALDRALLLGLDDIEKYQSIVAAGETWPLQFVPETAEALVELNRLVKAEKTARSAFMKTTPTTFAGVVAGIRHVLDTDGDLARDYIGLIADAVEKIVSV